MFGSIIFKHFHSFTCISLESIHLITSYPYPKVILFIDCLPTISPLSSLDPYLNTPPYIPHMSLIPPTSYFPSIFPKPLSFFHLVCLNSSSLHPSLPLYSLPAVSISTGDMGATAQRDVPSL